MPIWQRRPIPKKHRDFDLASLTPGVVVIVRAGETVYWLTTVENRVVHSDHIVGVAIHSNKTAPQTSPLYTSVARYLREGQHFYVGVQQELKQLPPAVISSIKVYDTRGVKTHKARGNRIVPRTGVDLALEKPGAVVMVQTAEQGKIYLTLAHPATIGPTEVRGAFVTHGHGVAPKLSPYTYTVTRHIAPGNWLRVVEGEGAQEREHLTAFVGGVSVNGIPRQ